MLRLIVQTKRKYKKKTQYSKNEKDEEGETEDHRRQQNGTLASASDTRHADEWEDQEIDGKMKISDFLKPEATEATKGNEMKNKDTWIKAARNRER